MKPIPPAFNMKGKSKVIVACPPQMWENYRKESDLRREAIWAFREGKIGEEEIPPMPLSPLEWARKKLSEYYVLGEKGGETFMAVGGGLRRIHIYARESTNEVEVSLEKIGRFDWAPLNVQQALWGSSK